MEIVILPDSGAVARFGSAVLADLVGKAPEAVLGLATGSSPLGIYAELAALVAAGDLDCSRAAGFALDEYVGIPLDHPQSYAAVIGTEVVEPLRMDPSRVHVPDGRAADIPAACSAYEAAIVAAGGIDLQILGLGANGHIGFNEPTSSFASRTRIKTLAPRTRADNARFFDPPTTCRPTASRRGSARSSRRSASCSSPRARRRPTPSPAPSRGRSRRSARAPCCSTTPT